MVLAGSWHGQTARKIGLIWSALGAGTKTYNGGEWDSFEHLIHINA